MKKADDPPPDDKTRIPASKIQKPKEAQDPNRSTEEGRRHSKGAKEEARHKPRLSNDEGQHHSKGAKEEARHTRRSSKDEGQHHSKLAKDEARHTRRSSKDEGQHKPRLSKDEGQQHSKLAKDEARQKRRSSKDEGQHKPRLSKDEGQQHSKLPKDEAQQHSKLSKDKARQKRRLSKDEARQKRRLSKDEEQQHSKLAKNEAPQLSKGPKDEAQQHSILSKDEARQKPRLSNDEGQQHSKLAKDEAPQLSKGPKDEAQQHSILSKDEARQKPILPKDEARQKPRLSKDEGQQQSKLPKDEARQDSNGRQGSRNDHRKGSTKAEGSVSSKREKKRRESMQSTDESEAETETEHIMSEKSEERLRLEEEQQKAQEEFLALRTVTLAITKPRRGNRLVAVGGGQAPFVMHKYATDLFNEIHILWIPLGLMFKLPFKVVRTGKTLEISIKRSNPLFWLSNLMMLFHLAIWGWVSVSTWNLFTYYRKAPPMPGSGHAIETACTQAGKKFDNIRTLETLHSRTFLMELFIFWCSMTHATAFQTNLMMNCYDYAAYVREWFRLADRCRFKVHKGIFWFIIRQMIYMVIAVSFHVMLHSFSSDIFPGVFASSTMMAMVFFRPLYYDSKFCVGKEPYYTHWATVGLLINIYFTISSRISLMFYFVIQRIYSNAWNSYNKRLEMAFGRREVDKAVGVRLGWKILFSDFNILRTTGKILGPVFKFNTVPWFGLQMFCIMVEVLVLAQHLYEQTIVGKVVYRGGPAGRIDIPVLTNDTETRIVGTVFRVNYPPALMTINILGHIALTLASFTCATWECDNAGRNATGHHQILRFEGMEAGKDEKEKAFILAYQASVIQKQPQLIMAGDYFSLTLGGVRDIAGLMLFVMVITVQFKVLKFRSVSQYDGGKLYVSAPLNPNNYTCNVVACP